MRARRCLLAIFLATLTGCPSPPSGLEHPTASASAVASTSPLASATAAPVKEPYGELDTDPQSFDFPNNPDVALRVAESAHTYFRFIQRNFARAVCQRFKARIASLPKARLHGDPHMEQYAVSDLGRGLIDFDDASVGPALMDLARFGTSALLASRIRGNDKDAQMKLLSELFRGYDDGLKGKLPAKDPPPFALELAKKFSKDRKSFLEFAQKNIEAVEAEERAFVTAELAAYVGAVKGKEPARPSSFYDVKTFGRTKLGIGSALTKKYLLRLEGPSKADDDDVIMELKQIADLSSVPCLEGLPSGAADAREAEQVRAGDKKHLLPILLPDGKFWVNEWLANYQEAKIKKLEGADLAPLAYEAGIFLAMEHKRPVPGKLQPPPLEVALRLNEELQQEIRTASWDLADATTKSWERFKTEVKAGVVVKP